MRDVMQKQESLNLELDDENAFDFHLADDEFDILDSWHFAHETHAHEIAAFSRGFRQSGSL